MPGKIDPLKEIFLNSTNSACWIKSLHSKSQYMLLVSIHSFVSMLLPKQFQCKYCPKFFKRVNVHEFIKNHWIEYEAYFKKPIRSEIERD